MNKIVRPSMLSLTPDFDVGPEPVPNRAVDIVYANITFEIGSEGLQFKIDRTKSGVWPNNSDIAGFLSQLATSQPMAKPPAMQLPETRPTFNPLDIEVANPSFLIFEIERKWNWRFRPEAKGLKTHLDQSNVLGGLSHVVFDANGEPIKSPSAPDSLSRCNVICMTLIDPGQIADAAYGFNLYIEFDQSDGKTLPLIVDPDIRNTGGSGLPFFSQHISFQID